VPLPEYFLQQDDTDVVDTQDFIAAMQVQDVVAAMHDYLETRCQFENGLSPANTNDRIVAVPDAYLAALSASLHSGFGPLFLNCGSDYVCDTSARIVIEVAEPLPKPPDSATTAFQFYNSAHVTWIEGGRKILIDKPAGSLYFSLDRAYGDALRVANLLLAAQ
jgi:hypothetical protein